jgi:hypothetical protein
MTTGAVGTAVALGTSESSLLIPQASSALAGGLLDATSTLLSFGGSTPSPSSSSTNAWIALGTVATASAFSDPLNATAVNSGWVVGGGGAKATESASGLRIVPGDGGAAALLQGSLPGDASVAVRVSLPPSGNGVSSGVVLYLDGEDWLTLTVGQDKRVALCVETQAKALPCVGSTANLAPSVRTIWLRVTRHATTFTGAYSVDGQAWVDSGEWNAGAPSARTTTSGPTATATLVVPTLTPTATSTAQATPSAAGGALAPAQVATGIAPLGFTQWGVFVTADAGTPNLPVFKDFLVAAAPTNP